MRGLESKGIDDIPQAIQEVLRKMPQRFWPEEYRKYASALGVCDNDGDSDNAEPTQKNILSRTKVWHTKFFFFAVHSVVHKKKFFRRRMFGAIGTQTLNT